jgi:hypothetical protein
LQALAKQAAHAALLAACANYLVHAMVENESQPVTGFMVDCQLSAHEEVVGEITIMHGGFPLAGFSL